MDEIIANPWTLLGLLWRLVLIAIPVLAIGWALTKGRNVDSDKLAAARTDVEARNVPPWPPGTPPGGTGAPFG